MTEMTVRDLMVLGNFSLNTKLNQTTDKSDALKEVELMLKNLKKWARTNQVEDKLQDLKEEIELIELDAAKEENGILVTDDKGHYQYDKEGAIKMVKAKQALMKEPVDIKLPVIEMTETIKANLPNDILKYFED